LPTAAACAGKCAPTLVRTVITVGFSLQRARFDGFVAQLVQLQAKAVAFVVRVSFDHAEFFHGIEQAMDSGLVKIERGGQLRDAEFGAVLAEVQKNAQGFLQRLAGTGRVDFADEGVSL
jgi:hypothetical protein